LVDHPINKDFGRGNPILINKIIFPIGHLPELAGGSLFGIRKLPQKRAEEEDTPTRQLPSYTSKQRSYTKKGLFKPHGYSTVP